MPDPGVLVAFALAALVISLAPGPDMFFIAALGVASGPRAGVLAAAGMSLGIAVHTIAAALGLGTLIQEVPLAYDVVRIAGAIYLVYLAISSFRAAGRVQEAPGPDPVRRSSGRVLGMALLTNLSNPKVIVFYLAFFPQFVDPAKGDVVGQFLLLGGLLIVIGLSVDASVGLVAGRFGDFLRRRAAVQRWLHRLAGGVFAALAARLATDT